MLETRDLRAGYGDFQALFGISLTVAQGATLARISHKTKIRRVANAKIHSYSRYLPGICAPATKKQCVFGVCSLVPDWLGNMLNELANYPTRHHSGLG